MTVHLDPSFVAHFQDFQQKVSTVSTHIHPELFKDIQSVQQQIGETVELPSREVNVGQLNDIDEKLRTIYNNIISPYQQQTIEVQAFASSLLALGTDIHALRHSTPEESTVIAQEPAVATPEPEIHKAPEPRDEKNRKDWKKYNDNQNAQDISRYVALAGVATSAVGIIMMLASLAFLPLFFPGYLIATVGSVGIGAGIVSWGAFELFSPPRPAGENPVLRKDRERKVEKKTTPESAPIQDPSIKRRMEATEEEEDKRKKRRTKEF